MYSLYRAWLSLNPSTGLPPLSVPPVPLNLSVSTTGQIPDAPDVTLQVGPSMTHFSAHRGVLSAHSGYFKAALANHGGKFQTFFKLQKTGLINFAETRSEYTNIQLITLIKICSESS